MTALQTLRNARWITRFVLVWFALFLGAAVASPLVKSDRTQMVCSTMGMKLVNLDADEGTGATPDQSMACPLCMPTAAPASEALPTPLLNGLGHALHPLETARLASLIGPPWQARGPPTLSA